MGESGCQMEHCVLGEKEWVEKAQRGRVAGSVFEQDTLPFVMLKIKEM